MPPFELLERKWLSQLLWRRYQHWSLLKQGGGNWVWEIKIVKQTLVSESVVLIQVFGIWRGSVFELIGLLRIQASTPSLHVYSSLSSSLPHFPLQAPPRPQQLGMPLGLVPHFGHLAVVKASVVCVVMLALDLAPPMPPVTFFTSKGM